MMAIERLARAKAAIDKVSDEQYVHCMGPQDAFGTYPALKNEYDDALEAVIREHATGNLAPSDAWHPVEYYQQRWAEACITAYPSWAQAAHDKRERDEAHA